MDDTEEPKMQRADIFASSDLSLTAAAGPAVDYPASGMTDRRLAMVRARLVANLGSTVAGWFRIVPAGQIGDELSAAALLLEGHLPILMPVNDLEAGPAFFVASYAADGRRSASLAPAAHESLPEALLAASSGFHDLMEHVDRRALVHPAGQLPHSELPEEAWLRHQLSRQSVSGSLAV